MSRRFDFEVTETFGGVPDRPGPSGSFVRHLGHRDATGVILPSMPTCPLCNGDGLELKLAPDGSIRESECRLCEGHGSIPRGVFEKVRREVNYRLCEGD